MTAPLSDGAPLAVRLTRADERVIAAVLKPIRLWTSPRFFGLENIPATGGVLLAANHNLYGGIDAPLIVEEVYNQRGRLLRSLAEDILIGVPGLRDLMHRWGSVRASRSNCRSLLAQDEAVIVFPGGGREAVRRKGEKYALKWDNRTGFARMAIEAGCPIVPVAAIGIDDALDIVADANHPVYQPIKPIAERLGFRWELAPPIVKGIGPLPIPRPERFYFSFGTPIDTTPWADSADLDAAAAEVRDIVRKSVEEELRFLLAKRDRDAGRTLRGRIAAAFR